MAGMGVMDPRYQVWSKDGRTSLLEGTFESLLQAIPFACKLGEACLILDSEIPGLLGKQVTSNRVVATVSASGEYVLQ